jgi:hypothetical protein
VTIQAAKTDGVELDPADGLSYEELSWLHRNVGRYNQEIVDVFNAALKRVDITRQPVYTHSLQHRSLFPGCKINHPASEWAYASGVRSGIEGIWCLPAEMSRVREWGRWSNLNREETDPKPFENRIWDLRVSYMMGADLYNSYNWHLIGPQRVFDYFNEFLCDLPLASLPPASVESVDETTVRFRSPIKLQAFTRIEVPVSLSVSEGMATVGLRVVDGDGQAHYSARQKIDMGNHPDRMAFDFTCPAETPWEKDALLEIVAYNQDGQPMKEGVAIRSDSLNQILFSLDLTTQRALSLAVINRIEKLK